jgi:Tfp pilus assembly protein PilO
MNRNIFFSILALLVITTGAWLYYSFGIVGVKTRTLEAQLQEINDRFNELSMVSDSYDEFKLKFNQKLIAFDTLKTIIPDNQMYAGVLESIRQTAERHKLQIISLAPTLVDIYPPLYTNMKIARNHIECYPLQFKFYGDFLTIGAFLDDLMELETKVNIASLKLETEMEHGGMLTCELNLYTYIFIEGA